MDRSKSTYESSFGSRFWDLPGMASEKSSLESGGSHSSRPGMSLMTVLVDAGKLLDLQAQLLQVDLVEFWGRSRWAFFGMATGLVFLVSAMPIAGLALVQGLQSYGNMTPFWSYALVGFGGIVLAGIALALGARAVMKAGEPLKRSREEIAANIAWIREVLHQD